MTLADAMHEHRRRWMTQLARLRMLARGEPGVPLPAAAIHDIDEATGAVVAEAKAAQRAVLSALASSRRRDPAAARLLATRLARLTAAAQDAVSAARDGNGTALRQHVHRFQALTSATWSIQLAVAPAARPLPSPRPPAGTGRAFVSLDGEPTSRAMRRLR